MKTELQSLNIECRDVTPRTLLLHVCCGPCATHSLNVLQSQYDVTLFFSNSNIAPESEYRKRLQEAEKLAGQCGAPLVEDKYDHSAWLQYIAGLESEPEQGERCLKCFEFNLKRTSDYAAANGFDLFTTTLTISPHKRTETIFKVGQALGSFLCVDFKKKNGFQESVRLSKEHDLYRQSYCGCEFSRR